MPVKEGLRWKVEENGLVQARVVAEIFQKKLLWADDTLMDAPARVSREG